MWGGTSLYSLPTVGLGVDLIFKISGRGMMDPDAPIPLDTLTLVPSSRYLVPTLHGFLQKETPGSSEKEQGEKKNVHKQHQTPL